MQALLWLLALLISYGSLFPFNFEPGAAAATDVVTLLAPVSQSLNRRNVVANILLFLPWGLVAGLAAPQAARPRAFLIVSLSLALMLAMALQVAQLWLPGRNAASDDAMINGVGLAVGLALAWIFNRWALPGQPLMRNLCPVPLGLALLWIAYRWFPLVPALELQNVLDGLKPLITQDIDPSRVIVSAAGWLACLMLLHRAVPATRPLALLALLALVVTALQPWMVGGVISPANALGVVLALALLPLLHLRSGPALAATGLLLALFQAGLQPGSWSSTPGSFHWLPFTGFLQGSMGQNLQSLLFKCYMYGAAVYLLRLAGTGWRVAGGLTAGCLLVVEVLQVWLPSRTAEITDPVLALLLAWVLARLEPAPRPTDPAR